MTCPLLRQKLLYSLNISILKIAEMKVGRELFYRCVLRQLTRQVIVTYPLLQLALSAAKLIICCSTHPQLRNSFIAAALTLSCRLHPQLYHSSSVAAPTLCCSTQLQHSPSFAALTVSCSTHPQLQHSPSAAALTNKPA